jgi:hypothetical protein
MDDVMHEDFQECSACSDKSGTPTLCSPCLFNRTLVSRLQERVRNNETTLKIVHCIMRAARQEQLLLNKVDECYLKHVMELTKPPEERP